MLPEQPAKRIINRVGDTFRIEQVSLKTESSPADPLGAKPKRRVRIDPVVRRRQIVAEATRLIARSNFNAVSLADVANACDVGKSTILHYFPTMKALLIAVLLGRDARDVGEDQPVDDRPISASDAKALVTERFEEDLHQREIIRLFYVLAASCRSYPMRAAVGGDLIDLRRFALG